MESAAGGALHGLGLERGGGKMKRGDKRGGGVRSETARRLDLQPAIRLYLTKATGYLLAK
jgi:hypothetical protein